VLVASSLLLLAVVSALVAFNGWPGTGLTENISSLVVDEPQRLTVEGPAQVALNAAPTAAAVAGSPAPGTAAASTGSTVATTADLRRAPAGVAPPADPDRRANLRDVPPDQGNLLPPDRLPPEEPGGGLLPETPLSPQVNRLTGGLGDTTQGLTDNLGGTVGRVNPQLGQTVTDTGRMLADLVRGLGRPRR